MITCNGHLRDISTHCYTKIRCCTPTCTKWKTSATLSALPYRVLQIRSYFGVPSEHWLQNSGGPNPKSSDPKKTDILHNTLFLSAPLVSVITVCCIHGNSLPINALWPPCPWLLKESNAMLLISILAFLVCIVLCLLILTFIITCLHPFHRAHKTKLTQTHFNGSGSALKLPVTQ